MTVAELNRDPAQLAKIRRDLIIKGFCNKKDIASFVPCGGRAAAKIYADIEDGIRKRGKRPLPNKVLTSSLLDYLGLRQDHLLQMYKEVLSGKRQTD